MLMNYIFGFALILLILVALNIYFFYTLNVEGKKHTLHSSFGHRTHRYYNIRFSLPNFKFDDTPGVHGEIYQHLNYLPSQYKSKNTKFLPVQKYLIQKFNTTNFNILNIKKLSEYTEKWQNVESLFNQIHSAPGKILHEMRTSRIVKVGNAHLGTQLKLLLTLEGETPLIFKPKRYGLTRIVDGKGHDRHNAEVFAYYLAMVMNFKWIAPAVTRRIHVFKDVLPVATKGLKESMFKKGRKLCIYGRCHYCRENRTICPDKHGKIEGAAILKFKKYFRDYWSPWRRSKNSTKMEWQTNNNYCKKLSDINFPVNLILDLVDVSLFDFLIQNRDRHAYQVYNEKIMLFDNGKGLANPMVDELDILAPLYQCCKMSYSTWQHLEMLSGGILTETIKLLASFQGEKLATEDHFEAVERRLLKIYATVQYCIGKRSSAKVFIIS